MAAADKLKEGLAELKAERARIDRQIEAVERALAEGPVARPRGRRRKGEVVASE